MNEKTKTYVQFIKENHKDLGEGSMTGAAIAKHLGISQGRVSQIKTEAVEEMQKEKDAIISALQPVNQDAAASTAEA